MPAATNTFHYAALVSQLADSLIRYLDEPVSDRPTQRTASPERMLAVATDSRAETDSPAREAVAVTA